MSAVDITAGYPVHAVARFAQRTNTHGVVITDWRATCGATGQEIGSQPFGTAGSARRKELCRACWSAGHATPHEKPSQVSAL